MYKLLDLKYLQHLPQLKKIMLLIKTTATWIWFALVFIGIPLSLYYSLFYSETKFSFTQSFFFMISIFTTSFWNIYKRNDEYIIFPQLLKMLLSIVVGILSFANVYKIEGLRSPDATVVHNAIDSLYFSIVTWTTLGYGDFQPTGPVRMYAACEALLGTIFIPLILSAIIFSFDNKKST